ncbi:LacI family DNA-binding transcriptional regulator [Nocardioides sp.]|uniref:LacI family DNA-binding transcriptional regulator n=1 Tax=Nocardioides sp. TaxID=35761 RepID=UPI00352933C5
MTGINDVAHEVGLSTATVSRALRNLPGVSEETRQRVVEAAQRLGYVASPAASVLAGGETRTIAVVAPFVTRWFFATVVEGAESVLRQHGYDVLLYSLGGDQATRSRVLHSHQLTKRVDGVLVLGIEPTDDEELWLHTHAPPVSLVGARMEGCPSVSIDDERAARIGLQHLLDLGHRRIAYVGGSATEPLDFSTPRARLRGYRSTLTTAGIPLRAEYETYGHFTIEGGFEAGGELLSLEDPPTAIFCASDEMAIGVLSAARERGVSVPGQLSVMGIDDHLLARYIGLSTVRQPVVEQGQIAARNLLEVIRQRRLAPSDRVLFGDTVLPAELVARTSTGPADADRSVPGRRST